MRLRRGAGRERISMSISQEEKDERLLYLMKLVDDELYLLSQGVYSPSTSRIGQPAPARQPQPQPPLPSPPQLLPRPVKRRLSEEDDNEFEFHTAPNSPVKNPDVDEFPDSTLDNVNWTPPLDPAQRHIAKSPKRGPSRFVERLTAPEPPLRRYEAVQENNANANGPQFSFSTTSTSLITEPPRDNNYGLVFRLTLRNQLNRYSSRRLNTRTRLWDICLARR